MQRRLFHRFYRASSKPVSIYTINVVVDSFNEGINSRLYVLPGTSLSETVKQEFIVSLAEAGGGFIKIFNAKNNNLIWEFVLTQKKAKRIMQAQSLGVQKL